jgi:hypothetical protein
MSTLDRMVATSAAGSIGEASGIFAQAQADYAARGIATFPCGPDKRPLVKSYDRIGLPYSAKLAQNPAFASATGVGFVAGSRSKVTIIDIDSHDDQELARALDRHGHTPLIARTPSGGAHLYYRWNSERRLIRPWKGVPVDVLGGGLAILPPTISTKGQYRFIEGTIADLDRLPAALIEHADREVEPPHAVPMEQPVRRGDRNNSLFRYCMRQAHYCDTQDDLLDVARTFNGNIAEPLDDEEVVRVARQVWRYTEAGQNRFGQHGAWFPTAEANELIRTDQDAFVLLAFLRANQKPDAAFMIANGLAETLGWSRQRLAKVRARIAENGYLAPVRKATTGRPALFRWSQTKSSVNK